jgi:nicotinamide-nucleotide amidase
VPPDPEIFALAKQVGERLRALRKSLAVAESCTGGLLGAAITDVPGSSAYFLGGVISYADQVKRDQLGVSDATLRGYGAVSKQTAAAMASGVRQLLHADVGVSITGVAGPDAEGSKPVGLTFIGVATPTLPSPRGGGKITTSTYRFQWTGDRWDNRRRSVIAALELLVRALEL